MPSIVVLEIKPSDVIDCSTPEVELLCSEDAALLLMVEVRVEVSSDLDMLVVKREPLSLSLIEMFDIPAWELVITAIEEFVLELGEPLISVPD